MQDTGPFLDTELLVLAERAGLRIAEMPVDWAGSRIGTAATAVADLRSAARALTAGRRPVAALRAQFGRAPLASHPVSYGVASQVITWWRRTIRRSPSAARRSMTSASR